MTTVLTHLGLMLLYSGVSTVLLLAILKFVDWATPKIDIEKELVDNKNMAVALPVAAFILAVAAIVIAVIVS